MSTTEDKFNWLQKCGLWLEAALSGVPERVKSYGGSMLVNTTGAPAQTESRTAIIDAAITPADNTAVAITELRTYTFGAGYRNIAVEFLSDPSNSANGPQGVSFTVNASGDGDAANKLSIDESDADDEARRVPRAGEDAIKNSAVDITRVDLVGILPGGTPTYANDLAIVRVW